MVLRLALACLEYRKAREFQRKSLANVIRIHRDAYARRILEGACRMVLEVGALTDVLTRFTFTLTGPQRSGPTVMLGSALGGRSVHRLETTGSVACAARLASRHHLCVMACPPRQPGGVGHLTPRVRPHAAPKPHTLAPLPYLSATPAHACRESPPPCCSRFRTVDFHRFPHPVIV
jgi:hypothetical protein